jgi:hypothetical protein
VAFTCSVAQVPLSGHCDFLSSDTKCTAVCVRKEIVRAVTHFIGVCLFCTVELFTHVCHFNSSVLSHFLH